MPEPSFDSFARKLTSVRSRRHALALLIGSGTLAGLGSAEARKGGKGKGKHKGKGKGKGKTKVFICHHTDTSIELIRVGSPAVKGHTKHGDTVCGTAGACHTGDPVACDQTTGACAFTAVPEGTTCTNDLGETGQCSANGECVVL